MTTSVAVLLAIVLVGVAALLSSVESALGRVSRVRSVELAESGRRGSGALLVVAADSPSFVNVALFLRMAAEVGAAVLVVSALLDRFPERWQSLVVAALIMLVVSYVVIGVGPRTLGRQHAVSIALVAAGPLRAITLVVGPLTQMLILIGNALTPGRGFKEGPFASEAELRELVDLAERSNVIEDEERLMIHSVFELGDTLVREVMVPRTDMVFVERHKTLRQATSLALRAGFSRIPVIGEDADDVLGIVYLKDLTRRTFDSREAESTERVEQVMRTPFFVPDSKPVDALLREMQAARVHVAVVVDEYGGTAGLVTIEDILEEIVGEITDEYDVEIPEVDELFDGRVRVSARMHVEDLGEEVGAPLVDDDVDSIGGLLGKMLGRVPIAGSTIEVAGLRLTAESLAGRRNRISTVLVERLDGAPTRARTRRLAKERAPEKSGEEVESRD